MKENMTIVTYSFYYPQWQNARAIVMANLSKMNKLPKTMVFVAAENGQLKSWIAELVALFFLKTGTFSAKNWQEISADVISFFVEIFCVKRGKKYIVTLINRKLFNFARHSA